MRDYIKLFNAPDKCYEGGRITKKLFYEEGNLNSIDKQLFTTDIKKITLEYMFSEDRINIKPYKDKEIECEEIAVIRVILENDKKYRRICEIIQKSIPYSIILICEFKSKVIFNVASKKINKLDSNRNIVDEMLFTKWISLDSEDETDKNFFEELNTKNWSYIDLYKFYSSFINNIRRYNASKYSKDIQALKQMDIKKVKEITDKIRKNELELETLKSKLKKETQFNKKVELNIQIKKIQTLKSELIKELNN